MTRINLVPPSELSREHLIAEYRELPRVFDLAFKAFGRRERPTDERFNQGFCLGSGHLLHFYPRLEFLADRHDALCIEMDSRGYKTTLRSFWYASISRLDIFGNAWWDWWQPWEPTEDEIAMSRRRILERLTAMEVRKRVKAPTAY